MSLLLRPWRGFFHRVTGIKAQQNFPSSGSRVQKWFLPRANVCPFLGKEREQDSGPSKRFSHPDQFIIVTKNRCSGGNRQIRDIDMVRLGTIMRRSWQSYTQAKKIITAVNTFREEISNKSKTLAGTMEIKDRAESSTKARPGLWSPWNRAIFNNARFSGRHRRRENANTSVNTESSVKHVQKYRTATNVETAASLGNKAGCFV